MMTQEQTFLKIIGIDEYQAKLINHSPDWLKDLRRRAVAQFIQLGLPTVKDEEWKYTSLAELSTKRLQIASSHKFTQEQALHEYVDTDDINIVLVNGLLWADYFKKQQLPKGITIKPLSEAILSSASELQETMTKLTANDTKALLYLNQALFLDGIYIKIENNVVIEPTIHIVHLTSSTSGGADSDTILFPRSFIVVETGAKVSILESHIGFGEQSYWSNALTDIRIGENAHVRYCKAEGESSHAVHTATTRIWQESSSQLEAFSFIHHAKLVRNNTTILLKGEGTHTIMNGLYAIDGLQHVDNHTLIDIQQPNCTCSQLYKGILSDASHAVFNGKIFVHPIAQKTNGYQLNKHLLLGNQAKVDTKPQLEIFADDVKCTHGATIGQLNDEEIFYLQSRSISRELARQLLAKGFIDDIINTISSASIRRKLNKLLVKKFSEIKL